ncbi:MAG: efflux transporter outer membrane subunit [Desulforhopalus sp.]
MNIQKKILTAGLLLIVLNGCTMAPEYLRPALPVAENFAGVDGNQMQPPEEGQQLREISELGWRNVFTDPDLQQLIGTALHNNRDLRETALNVEAYQALYRIQRAALLPTITGEGYGAKQRTLTGAGHSTSEVYSLDIGTTAYELDFYGRIRNLKDQSLEQYLALEEIHKSATISLVAEVARAYLTWLTDKELLQISEDTRKNEEESYALIEQRVGAGIANELDLAQARTSLENVKANLALYQRQVAQDLHYLSLLTGTSLPASFLDEAASVSIRDLELLSVMPSDLSSTVLLGRPDIMAAEHQLVGANANIGAARAAFFPTVRLTASAGFISSDLSDLFANGSGAWLFSPSVSLPIFTAGRLQAELDVAEIEKEIYVARYEKAIQTAFREVSDALVASDTYQDQMRAQRANLVANEDYYTHARDRYEQGVDSFLVLLDAQRSLYTSRQNYLTLNLAQLANQVDLYKVLGGGWIEKTE